jgi:hypothetical protein
MLSPALTPFASDLLASKAAFTELPEPGWIWDAPAEAAWQRVIGQISAVGSSRSWDALGTETMRQAFSVSRIRASKDPVVYVHRLLVKAKVRYCSPEKETSVKASAISVNAHLPFVADAAGEVPLRERLREQVGDPDERTGLWTPDQARSARRLLIQELHFFGPKSASDFLLGLGLADSLLAFDVRLLHLLIDDLGWSPDCRACVSRLADYEMLEARVLRVIGEPLGMTGLLLDRLLFQHYKELSQELNAAV